MVETKPFKTKLCILYQSGRCERQTCTFAHGNRELRQFSGSFAERRSNKGDDDLRNKLDGKCSPEIKYSPGRDSRGSHAPGKRRSNKGDDDLRNKLDGKCSPEIKYSPGRDSRGSHAPGRFSPSHPHKQRKYRTRFDMDGQNDFQRNSRSEDGTPKPNKDEKFPASDTRITLSDELKQVQDEVNMLFDQKCQLKVELEERVQEEDNLSSKISDLETQLSEEKDNFKRINSKIKIFIGAHVHHFMLKNQVKRSQFQLQQMMEDLGLDATQIDVNEDHLNVNIIIDEAIPQLKDHTTTRKRPLQNNMNAPQAYKSGIVVKGQGIDDVDGFVKSSHVHLNGNKNAELDNRREDTARPSRERKSRRRTNSSKSYVLVDKVLESHFVAAPPISMAAHAVDDYVELTEADEGVEHVEIATSNEDGMLFSLPPLPPMAENNYFQYQGDDENIDIDGLDADREA